MSRTSEAGGTSVRRLFSLLPSTPPAWYDNFLHSEAFPMLRPCLFLLFALPLVAADPTTATIPIRRQVPVEVAKQIQVPDKSGGKIVRIETNTVWKTKSEEKALKPERSAIIICDMWDDHWCKEAAKRCDGLAKATAPLIEAARKAGVTIIHSPSDTMDFYKD